MSLLGMNRHAPHIPSICGLLHLVDKTHDVQVAARWINTALGRVISEATVHLSAVVSRWFVSSPIRSRSSGYHRGRGCVLVSTGATNPTSFKPPIDG